MNHLLYKEFRLCVHPTMYFFTLLGCLVLVPSYPYGIVFLFGCTGAFLTFQNEMCIRDRCRAADSN